MDFTGYLKQSAGEVNREIETFFRRWEEEVKKASPKLLPLSNRLTQASEGGKRLRGTLVRLGYEMTGTAASPEIFKPAAAFEIFQTSILAHDDIIDLSPLRRGSPTVYQALGANHYAISQTICLGDIGYFLAVRMIAKSDFPAERKNEALSLFAQAMLETALGQMLDVELPYRQELAEESDALTVFRLKTARYTVSGPLSLGAILGGADGRLLSRIDEFGENLGVAFQIQDDILGVFGDEKTVGKSVTSDIEEGKNTLLIIHALEKAVQEQKEVLNKYYGKGKIGEEELSRIRQVFLETGALDYSKQKAAQLVGEAKAVIERMEIAEDKKQMLRQMADFLVERQK